MAPVKAAAPKLDYYKVGDGFLYTNWYADGAKVRLTEAQSKYKMLEGQITDQPPPMPKSAPMPDPTTPAPPAPKSGD